MDERRRGGTGKPIGRKQNLRAHKYIVGIFGGVFCAVVKRKIFFGERPKGPQCGLSLPAKEPGRNQQGRPSGIFLGKMNWEKDPPIFRKEDFLHLIIDYVCVFLFFFSCFVFCVFF